MSIFSPSNNQKTILAGMFTVDILHICDYLSSNSYPIPTTINKSWKALWIEENSFYIHYISSKDNKIIYGFVNKEDGQKIHYELSKAEFTKTIRNYQKGEVLTPQMNYEGFISALMREPKEYVLGRYKPQDIIEPLVKAYIRNETSAINTVIIIKAQQNLNWELEIESALKTRIKKNNESLLIELKKLHLDIRALSKEYARIIDIRNSMVRKFPKDVEEYYSNIKYIETVEKKLEILRHNLDKISKNKHAIENESERYATFINENDYLPEEYAETEAKWNEIIEDYRKITHPKKT